MLQNFTIRNFRLFEALDLDRLRRVNLFVGKNNTGKTALLEAVQVFGSEAVPRVLWKLVRNRQETWRGDWEELGSEEIGHPLRHLFRGHRLPGFTDEGILLGPIHDQHQQIQLRVAAYALAGKGQDDFPTRMRVPPSALSDLGGADLEVHLVAERNGRTQRLVHLNNGDPAKRVFAQPEREAVQVVPTWSLDGHKVAALWDLIGLTPLEGEVIRSLQLIDGSIEAVAFVENPRSRGNRIPLVRTRTFSEPIPLYSMGDGIARLFQIILALVSAKNGVLLIDEAENGLHWTIQPRVWKTIFRLAQELEVQVFATTHSRDCVEAFREAWQEEPEAGCFYRLSAGEGGRIQPVSYDLETLSDAVETDVEVR